MKLLAYVRSHRISALLAVIALGIACGSSSTVQNVAKKLIEVQISPSRATIGSGGKLKFTAAVSGTGNDKVTWTVTAGTITTTGVFTAPVVTTATQVQVFAASIVDPSSTAQAQVTVNPPALPQLPAITSFTTTASCTISGAVTLSWTSTNATSASLTSDAGSGNTGVPVPVNGTQNVTPKATTLYTLTATNAGGSVTQSLTVMVATAMVLHAYDPVTGVELLPPGGPFPIISGGQLQFKAIGGCQ